VVENDTRRNFDNGDFNDRDHIALHRFSHSCLFRLAAGKIQYRHTANLLFHRITDTGQCHIHRFAYFTVRQCLLITPVAKSLVYHRPDFSPVFPVGLQIADVFPEIQEPVVERQSNALYLPGPFDNLAYTVAIDGNSADYPSFYPDVIGSANQEQMLLI
jgi:hypothetical protein